VESCSNKKIYTGKSINGIDNYLHKSQLYQLEKMFLHLEIIRTSNNVLLWSLLSVRKRRMVFCMQFSYTFSHKAARYF